jgi:hypothetical protein
VINGPPIEIDPITKKFKWEKVNIYKGNLNEYPNEMDLSAYIT